MNNRAFWSNIQISLQVDKVLKINEVDPAKEFGGEIIPFTCWVLYRSITTKDGGRKTEECGGGVTVKYV